MKTYKDFISEDSKKNYGLSDIPYFLPNGDAMSASHILMSPDNINLITQIMSNPQNEKQVGHHGSLFGTLREVATALRVQMPNYREVIALLDKYDSGDFTNIIDDGEYE